MSNTTSTNDTTATQTAIEKAKRTRTSPRLKALDEAIALLDEHLADLQEEEKEAAKNVKPLVAAKVEVLSDFRGKVVSLALEGAQKPSYDGRHYIAQLADGSFVAFDCNVPPTKRSHGEESKFAYTKVYGPFRTEGGVEYRLSHLDELAKNTPIF